MLAYATQKILQCWIASTPCSFLSVFVSGSLTIAFSPEFLLLWVHISRHFSASRKIEVSHNWVLQACQLVAFCLCLLELAFCALDVLQADCQVIVKKSYQKGEYLDVICCVVCLTLVHCAWQGRAAGFCALCALQAHVKQALSSSGNVVSPSHLVKNLRCILWSVIGKYGFFREASSVHFSCFSFGASSSFLCVSSCSCVLHFPHYHCWYKKRRILNCSPWHENQQPSLRASATADKRMRMSTCAISLKLCTIAAYRLELPQTLLLCGTEAWSTQFLEVSSGVRYTDLDLE